MQDTFNKLKQLQDVLSQKIEIEREIEDIPKRSSKKEEMLNRMKRTYIEKNEAYTKIKKRKMRLKLEIEEVEASRENSEKKMNIISTQREYELLDKEIKEAAEKEQKLRWEMQEQEKRHAEMSESLKREEMMINDQQAELEADVKKNSSDVQGKEVIKAELLKQEAELIPGLDGDMLFKFERIIRNKLGVGIVAIAGNICTGCHVILPNQFVNEVRMGQDILFCPYCSRILFYQAEDTQEDIAVNEVGGLTDLVSETEL